MPPSKEKSLKLKNRQRNTNAAAVDQTKVDEFLAQAENAQSTENNKPKPASKSKVVRDTFTFPEKDYKHIEAIQTRLMKLGISKNKSEIIRAGLVALACMTDSQIKEAQGRVEKVKTGRPR